MDEDTFTYILPPAASPKECIRHLLQENLPTLVEASTDAEGRRGTLIISRSEFIADVLCSFDYQKCNETPAPPGGAILPTAVVPGEAVSLIPVPPIFDGGDWPRVWTQFVRDVPRETLLIENTLYDNAFIAFDRIQNLLDNAYDDIPKDKRGHGLLGFDKSLENGGIFPLFSTVWYSFRDRLFSSDGIKKREVAKAIRLAIIASQQTILAFPVELLHAQFSKFRPYDENNNNTHAEHQVIYIGEPQKSFQAKIEDCDNPHAATERMKVRIERRRDGIQLPFVRVEKTLDAFTVDDAANHSTKLRFQIAIEINFFSNDGVELTWEWRRPPEERKV
ncbi:hypothetical protein LSM04_001008 [Trypanosoma melophagium]|uniref:uncharacterized protein n=1 Tax=Trypanosoma melophagium TaxID=715481 RepID=UPI00351A77F0|nr:hypothetical protein LSM04_001008 [Trypanosoma melophagium]